MDHPSYLINLARVCSGSYANPATRSQVFRYVDPYWMEGGLLGLIERDDAEVRVVFRGTSERGNWVLTNAQAYELSPSSALPGVKTLAQIEGRVHQGFLRAFSSLWIPDPPPFEPASSAGGTKYLLSIWMSLVAVAAYWLASLCHAGVVIRYTHSRHSLRWDC